MSAHCAVRDKFKLIDAAAKATAKNDNFIDVSHLVTAAAYFVGVMRFWQIRSAKSAHTNEPRHTYESSAQEELACKDGLERGEKIRRCEPLFVKKRDCSAH